MIDLAIELIAGLNVRYGADRFYLLNRRRIWNASEGRWMGWERKRGKLHEFNRVLRGAIDTTFDVITGDLESLEACGTSSRSTRTPIFRSTPDASSSARLRIL